ncbi:MAG: DUF4235 domain-containing protein [Candidatus Nanopelagicales bacterium]
MRPQEPTSTSAKILYKPVGITSSIIAGIIAGQLVQVAWKHATPGSKADPPQALESEYPLREVLAAAALQGAVFSLVKAATQRGGARLFQRMTGEWPGN